MPPTAGLEISYTILAAVLIPLAVLGNMFWKMKNQFPVEGRLVVITGGSQGMGKAVAIQLAGMGADVVIVARDQKKLENALEEIKAAAKNPETQKFKWFSAELSSADANQKLLQDITAWGGIPEVIWCIAGSSTPCYFKDMSPALLEKQMTNNYFSCMHMAHAAINLFTSSPKPAGTPNRKIIFTSSVACFFAFTGYGSYSPTKAAIRALADVLRQECLLYDIDVSCVFPGGILSPGFQQENITKPDITKAIEGSDEPQTPEEVAKVSIAALEKGEFMIVTNFMGGLLRACAWGGSQRSNLIWDTVFSWIVSIIWWFALPDADSKVTGYKKKNGVPPPQKIE